MLCGALLTFTALYQDTPSYTYSGKNYYFCGTDCRDKFAKNPTKYLSAK